VTHDRVIVATPEQLVAVVKMLVSVVRNIHLKRALVEVNEDPKLNFWRLMHGNLMDMAVIDWCKVFGSDDEQKQKLHWNNVVDDQDGFREGLLRHIGLDETCWCTYWNSMKKYRDQHAAHADFDKRDVKHYPMLNLALTSSYFYYGQIIGELHRLGKMRYPLDFEAYGEKFFEQAVVIGRTAAEATQDVVERVY
jgi:hypothetical protein